MASSQHKYIWQAFLATTIITCVIVYSFTSPNILMTDNSNIKRHGGISDDDVTLQSVYRTNVLQPKPMSWQALKNYTAEHLTPGQDEYKYHIAITSCGAEPRRLEEAFVALKSTLLMAPKHHVFFHIFASTRAQTFLQQHLNSLPISIRITFSYKFYAPYFPSNEWRDLFALCSTQRLFIAEKIRLVKHLMYMDTDAMLVAPLADVFREFDNFGESNMIAMAYNTIFKKGWYDSNKIPHLPPHGYNAGILLMDLEKMRKENWIFNLTRIMKQQKSEKSNVLGDQDILNEYFYYFPEKLHTMRCMLNFRSDYCQKQTIAGVNITQSCLDAEQYGAVILHASRKLAHKHKPNMFAVIHNAIKQYNFTQDLYPGLIKPIFKEIHKLEIADKRFNRSSCYNSKHLLLRNILTFAHRGNSKDKNLENLYKNNMSNSDSRLKWDIEYYLSKVHNGYNPHIENRTFPQTALMPLRAQKKSLQIIPQQRSM